MIVDESSFAFGRLLLGFFLTFSRVTGRGRVCFFSLFLLDASLLSDFFPFFLRRLREILYEVSIFMTFPAFGW